jgi:hypothetical protein
MISMATGDEVCAASASRIAKPQPERVAFVRTANGKGDAIGFVQDQDAPEHSMVTVLLNFPSPRRWQHDCENIGRYVCHRLHPSPPRFGSRVSVGCLQLRCRSSS